MLTFRHLTLRSILKNLNDCINHDMLVCQGTDKYIRRLVLDEYDNNGRLICTHTTVPNDIKWVDGILVMDKKKYSLMWEDENCYAYIDYDKTHYDDYYLILEEGQG